MDPRLESHPQRILAGLSYFGDPFHTAAGWTESNEIGRLWKRLIGYLSLADCPYSYPAVSYEVHIQNHVTPVTGEFEVFVGFEVSQAPGVPLELCCKVLPAAEYAVFTVRGDQIHADEPVVDNWLISVGYEMAFPLGVQRYDERFLGLDHLAESELEFLIPVRPLEPDERV